MTSELLFFILIALVVLEIGVRVIEATTVRGSFGALTSYIVWDGDFWRLKPKSIIVQSERLGDTEYVINSLGYRGAEVDTAIEGKRVVFLGDSITFGTGVAEPDTFFSLLSGKLKSAHNMDSVNLSLFAYSPYDYLNTWCRIAKNLKPDMVVLQIYMNDFGVKPSNTPVEVSLARKLRALFYLTISESAILRRLYQVVHMIFYFLIHDMRRTYLPRTLFDAEPKAIRALLDDAKRPDTVGGVFQLRELINDVKETGAKLLLFYSPNEVQMFTDQYDSINSFVRRIASGTSTPFVDLTQELRKSPQRRKFFIDGLHYSRQGHKEVAEILNRELLRTIGR
jgi:lysophospholipase L1-like esterase